MKLSTREDIEAPIGFVFDQISDFDAYERRALRQGIEVHRRTGGPVDPGTTWDIAFEFRGRARPVVAELVTLDKPAAMVVESSSDGLAVMSEVDLIALSQTRTRVMVNVHAKARTLTARMLMQTLKLAKTQLTKRFKGRVKSFAEEIEDRYRRDG